MTTTHTQDDQIFDVAIIGGGLAGLTLSCLLGQRGVKTICIDNMPSTSPQKDLRTTAISFGSHNILKEAGIWDRLPEICPIDDIQILDGDSPLLLNFLSAEVEHKSFGWIVDNAVLRETMRDVLKECASVTHETETSVYDFDVETHADYGIVYTKQGQNAQSIKARLIVGADGRGSFTRSWMGIRTRTWPYHQSAIICTVQHEHPHDNIAVEHFWPDGPFAILPMSERLLDNGDVQHRSSVVLTAHGHRPEQLMAYSDQDFNTILSGYFPARYGAVSVQTPRACYPLNLIHAIRYVGKRMVLVADAAHGIHPIAGQGLNLGFRDIHVLSQMVADAVVAQEDPGNPDILQRYEQLRRLDNTAMIAVTDSLNRLFSNDKKAVKWIRRMGLSLVSKLPPAKQFFMRQAMGDHV